MIPDPHLAYDVFQIPRDLPPKIAFPTSPGSETKLIHLDFCGSSSQEDLQQFPKFKFSLMAKSDARSYYTAAGPPPQRNLAPDVNVSATA
jgi:hypothetical protein